MGTWGTGLFDDDLLSDFRDGFEELVANGEPPEQVLKGLLDQYQRNADQYGRTLLEIAAGVLLKSRGVNRHPMIDVAARHLKSGSGLDPWRERSHREYLSRQREYARLLGVLESPSIRRKSQRKRRPRVGDVLRMPLADGRYGYCHLLAFSREHGWLTNVLDFVTETPVDVGRVDLNSRLFAVHCAVDSAVESGRWSRIGSVPVAPFAYPRFLSSGLPDRDGNVLCWWLIEPGKAAVKLGSTVPDQYAGLETIGIVSPQVVEERILRARPAQMQ
ncbi:MAG: Imm26 family immunity protein [Armatimonadota bacterium]